MAVRHGRKKEKVSALVASTTRWCMPFLDASVDTSRTTSMAGPLSRSSLVRPPSHGPEEPSATAASAAATAAAAAAADAIAAVPSGRSTAMVSYSRKPGPMMPRASPTGPSRTVTSGKRQLVRYCHSARRLLYVSDRLSVTASAAAVLAYPCGRGVRSTLISAAMRRREAAAAAAPPRVRHLHVGQRLYRRQRPPRLSLPPCGWPRQDRGQEQRGAQERAKGLGAPHVGDGEGGARRDRRHLRGFHVPHRKRVSEHRRNCRCRCGSGGRQVRWQTP